MLSAFRLFKNSVLRAHRVVPIDPFFSHVGHHICTLVPSSRDAIELSSGPNLFGLMSFFVWFDMFPTSGSVYDRNFHVLQSMSHEVSLVQSAPKLLSLISPVFRPSPILRLSNPRRTLHFVWLVGSTIRFWHAKTRSRDCKTAFAFRSQVHQHTSPTYQWQQLQIGALVCTSHTRRYITTP